MSKIEWTERTWNPIVGCSVVSPGCTNCYAMKMAARISRMNPELEVYGNGLTQQSKAGPVWTGKVAFSESALLAPLRRRKPTTYFVNSMSDLFHEAVPDEWIDRVFAVMALAPQHTFQCLTKRSRRMRTYFEGLRCQGGYRPYVSRPGWTARDTRDRDRVLLLQEGQKWPLRNVWLGVSAEDQTRADERVPDLLATPAAVRFVSAEPLLGPIKFNRIRIAPDHHTMIDALSGYATGSSISGSGQERTKLDWIIAGGESGPNARPMHPDWPRAIRDQCAAAGVPFFFKQWGEWAPHTPRAGGDLGGDLRAGVVRHLCADRENDGHFRKGDCYVECIGKRRAGRMLDGRTHDDIPARHV